MPSRARNKGRINVWADTATAVAAAPNDAEARFNKMTIYRNTRRARSHRVMTYGGGGGGGYAGPLDIQTGAVVAYGNFALSAAQRGQPLYTIQRTTDDDDQSFSSDATTGLAPVAAISSFASALALVECDWDEGGTGYGNAQTFNVTVVGGTFSAAATANVTTNAGGAITTVNSFTPGSYSVAPASPAATTGGSGTGLTLLVGFKGNYGALWNDQSASGLDGIADPTAPSWDSDAAGDLPAFVGGQGFASGDTITLANGKGTAFAVLKDSATLFLVGAGDARIAFTFSADDGGANAGLHLNDGAVGALAVFTPPSGFNGDVAIHEMVGDGTTWKYRINGQSATLGSHTDNAVAGFGGASTAISWSTVAGGTDAALSLWIVWNAALSDGVCTSIRQNIAAFHGITLL